MWCRKERRERTYADADGRRDADGYGWAVDGSLLVLLDDDLGRGSGRRNVKGRWGRVAVDVGVVGDVGEVRGVGHWDLEMERFGRRWVDAASDAK